MPDSSFDPYHQWLSISPEEQPANHYRLLGLKPFETNADIIDSAAQRQITYVRSFSLGQHAEQSQAILNELAAARSTLLKAVSKAEYDKQLRAKLQTAQASASRDLPTGKPVPQISPAPIFKPQNPRKKKTQARKKSSSKSVPIIAGVAGFFVMAALLSWALSAPKQPVVAELPTRQQRSNDAPTSTVTQPPNNTPPNNTPPNTASTESTPPESTPNADKLSEGLSVETKTPPNPSTSSADVTEPLERNSSAEQLEGTDDPVAVQASGASVESAGRDATVAAPEQPEENNSPASSQTSPSRQRSTRRPTPPPSADAPFDSNQAKIHQRDWAKHLRLPLDLSNSVGMRFSLIPPGKFTMGLPANANEELGPHSGSAKPAHEVNHPNAIYFGIHEVTEQQRAAVMNDVANLNSSRSLPARNVSWDEATAFCRKLSELPLEKSAGRVYRLPTEAEWEYVCRAGSTSRFFWGDDISRISEVAWFGGNSGRKVHAVGTKYPNPWGVHDMHGNLWEWCQDWYGPYQPQEQKGSPQGPPSGKTKIMRGGAFNGEGEDSAFRNMNPTNLKHNLHGLRVVLEISGGDNDTNEYVNSNPIPGPNDGTESERTSNAELKTNRNATESRSNSFFLGKWVFQVNGTPTKVAVTLNKEGTVTWNGRMRRSRGTQHWTLLGDNALLISDVAGVKGSTGWIIAYFPAPSGIAVCDDWTAGKAAATLTRARNAAANSGSGPDSWILGKWSYKLKRVRVQAGIVARSDGIVEWHDQTKNRLFTKYWSQFDSTTVLISNQPGVKGEEGWHLIHTPDSTGKAQCDDWGGGPLSATATRQR
ncbi:MAG: SUMF1/EgtB/PvdO family nonheme iron enzyme [Rubripirellula sp.]|nr:SUMF1/EgtB/PvdO family nonheme iron enzyme [Rubripirellula sp.]